MKLSIICPDFLKTFQVSPRIVKNFLSRLNLRCPHTDCDSILSLENYPAHVESCGWNPKTASECQKGCGIVLENHEVLKHNCVRVLREKVEEMEEKMVIIAGTGDKNRSMEQ